MAILYRGNALSRSFEEAPIRARVPYMLIGDVGFYQRAEIKDALALLRLAVTPDDAQADEAFRREINVPARGFGAKAMDIVEAGAAWRRVPLLLALETTLLRAEGEGHTEDQESTMDMYITALEPAPATLGPRSGDCLGPDPEAAGIAIKIAPISRQIWDAKYRLKAHDGTAIDVTIEDSWRRVARALAAPENDPERWEVPFYKVLEDFRFLPAGRILAGAGTERRVTLFNCFVMGNVEDDLGSIFSHLREAALTMQQGGGIGYDFSSLRPKGAPVRGVGADAS